MTEKHGMHSMIARLRKMDDRAKRKWVVGASAATMIVIGVLWVVYLNLTLPQIEVPSAALQTISREIPGTKDENTFLRGLSVVTKDVRERFSSFIGTVSRDVESMWDTLKTQNEFSVTKEEVLFVPTANPDPIPTTTLP